MGVETRVHPLCLYLETGSAFFHDRQTCSARFGSLEKKYMLILDSEMIKLYFGMFRKQHYYCAFHARAMIQTIMRAGEVKREV